jgi:hypothetical protein
MKKLFVLLVLAAAFAYFVWPTRYQEYKPGEGPHSEQTHLATRVDRLSGDVQAQESTGAWKDLSELGPREHVPNPVTSPYTRADLSSGQQKQNEIHATQSAIDAATTSKTK